MTREMTTEERLILETGGLRAPLLEACVVGINGKPALLLYSPLTKTVMRLKVGDKFEFLLGIDARTLAEVEELVTGHGFGSPWRKATAELRGVLLDVEEALKAGPDGLGDRSIWHQLPALELVEAVLARSAGDAVPALVAQDTGRERPKLSFTPADPLPIQVILKHISEEGGEDQDRYMTMLAIGNQYFTIAQDTEKESARFIGQMFLNALGRLGVDVSEAKWELD